MRTPALIVDVPSLPEQSQPDILAGLKSTAICAVRCSVSAYRKMGPHIYCQSCRRCCSGEYLRTLIVGVFLAVRAAIADLPPRTTQSEFSGWKMILASPPMAMRGGACFWPKDFFHRWMGRRTLCRRWSRHRRTRRGKCEEGCAEGAETCPAACPICRPVRSRSVAGRCLRRVPARG